MGSSRKLFSPGPLGLDRFCQVSKLEIRCKSSWPALDHHSGGLSETPAFVQRDAVFVHARRLWRDYLTINAQFTGEFMPQLLTLADFSHARPPLSDESYG